MFRKWILFVGVIVATVCGSVLGAQSIAPQPDYSRTSAWVCRPGADTVCTTGLDTKIVLPDGSSRLDAFHASPDQPIDCFYVYPTTSRESSVYSDLTDSPEIQQITRSQVGHLNSRCRVFAPIYRQITAASLKESLAGEGTASLDVPLADITTAWHYYLEHDNHGRGVVLVGHSQGAIVLQKLLSESIDGKPTQHLLVSAFLAGDPFLGVPHGRQVGGTFQQISPCHASGETGCFYTWGSFLDGAIGPKPMYSFTRKDSLEPVCVSPAAPEGGSATLKFFHPRTPLAPKSDPPFVEVVDQLKGACTAMNGSAVFLVTVSQGPRASQNHFLLQASIARPNWGLHVRDIGLVEGNILDVLDAETATWSRAHPAR